LEPSFDIAGRRDELILEIYLCQSFVAGTPQAVPTHQLTDSAFDRIALVHSKLKFRALLLASPLLERFVVGPHNNRAVGLILSNASGPIRAVMTLSAKLETVADFAAFLLGQFAAVGAGLSRRTDRF
jgi:hypothetical protein